MLCSESELQISGSDPQYWHLKKTRKGRNTCYAFNNPRWENTVDFDPSPNLQIAPISWKALLIVPIALTSVRDEKVTRFYYCQLQVCSVVLKKDILKKSAKPKKTAKKRKTAAGPFPSEFKSPKAPSTVANAQEAGGPCSTVLSAGLKIMFL